MSDGSQDANPQAVYGLCRPKPSRVPPLTDDQVKRNLDLMRRDLSIGVYDDDRPQEPRDRAADEGNA